MIRLNVLTEGQTEETFVRDVLAPHLFGTQILAVSRSVKTGRKHGRDYRGGLTRYLKIKKDIELWLKGDPKARLTTMIDLYHLPSDFPDYDQAQALKDAYDRVACLENALASDIGDHRFIPYIQLHEFEGLLFSDINVIDDVVNLSSQSGALNKLQLIRQGFSSPELIDDGAETAPAKRLKAIFPNYDKVAMGPRVVEQIGIARIRTQCRHFHEWIGKLEQLSNSELRQACKEQ